MQRERADAESAPPGEADRRVPVTDTNLLRFRVAVAGALAHLESRREELNDLNVFPVADGDTGDNMALTLRAVLDELDRLQGADERRTIDEIGREDIVQSVARAALLGARGNSGVILSQLIRGAAEELVSRPGQLIDATLIGAALANAADRAYSSVRDPVEGTILTVAREMAHKIVTDVAHSPENPRLGPATERPEQDAAIAETLERAIVAGQDAVKRSPELLAALREAGVVDAGGYGLTVIFAGVVAALRGDDPPELDRYPPARISHPEHSSTTYRFCTNFAVTGSGLSASRFLAPLEELGDSVLVVGDTTTLKVHLHTDRPELATAVFVDAGQVSRLDVADMHLQIAGREERLANSSAMGGHGTALAAGEDARAQERSASPATVASSRPVSKASAPAHARARGARAQAPEDHLAEDLVPREWDGDVPDEDLQPPSRRAVGVGLAANGRITETDRRATGTSTSTQPRGPGPRGPGRQPSPSPPSAAPRSDRGGVRCGAMAVVSGRGLAEMFHELGVHTLDGGPTFNPSTYDLLAGIHAVPAEEVVVLTNSANVIMAAEHAAKLSDKQVLVAPTTSQQAGLAAAVALVPDRTVEENAQALTRALARVRTASVAQAVRDDPQGRFKRGEAVGFVEDEVRAWGDPGETLKRVVRTLAEGTSESAAPELISVLAGENAPLGLEELEGMLNGEVELELRHGGQPAYWWLLAAE
jgi:dihydroxyacetone kinase-like predicted kinase